MKKTAHLNSSDDDAISRGKRLKRLRHLGNLDRKKLCEESAINIHTSKGSELGRCGGLTKKGAEKVIKTMGNYGVFCSLEWLLYNIGAGPKVHSDYIATEQLPHTAPQSDITNKNELAQIAKELELFKQYYKHTADFIVADDSMLPSHKIGDYVAGVKKFGQDIESLVGQNCIIHTKDGQTLLRQILHRGKQPETFSLICTNPTATIAEPVLYDIPILSASPIIWQRRRLN